MKFFKFCIALTICAFVISSCKDEMLSGGNPRKAPSLAAEYNADFDSVAFAVNQLLLKNVEFRHIIHTEVGKKFDGNYNVLISQLIEEHSSVVEWLKQLKLDVYGIVKKYPFIQIAIPVNYEKWDGEEMLPVVYFPYGYQINSEENLWGYDTKGDKKEFTKNEFLKKIFVVVCEKENGIYSEYIITPEDAMIMVANDLKQSGGEFAQKQISHVEPVMNYAFMELYNKEVPKMVEKDLIKATDPFIYIVHFEKDGFAIVQPDKDLGAGIIHTQTFGKVSCEDFYKGAYSEQIVLDKDSLICGYVGPNGEKLEPLFNWNFPNLYWDSFTKKLFANCIAIWLAMEEKRQPPDVWLQYDDWKSLETNVANTSFFVTSGAPLNPTPNYYLGLIAPTVIEFLGFLEAPKTMFGQTGDWNYIKMGFMAFPPVARYPVSDWAYKISQECTSGGYVDHFSKLESWLDDLGISSHVYTVIYNSAPDPTLYSNQYTWFRNPLMDINNGVSHYLRNGKPVIVYYNTEAGLAVKEEIQIRDAHTLSHVDGSIQDTWQQYRSYVWYKVSYQNVIKDVKILQSQLNDAMFFVIY